MEKSFPEKPKRKRGRPKDSRNKKAIERELLELVSKKQGCRRPKGSKNRKKSD